jgi:hypothetical protein
MSALARFIAARAFMLGMFAKRGARREETPAASRGANTQDLSFYKF